MRPIEPNRWAWAEAIVDGEMHVLLECIERPERGRKADKYTWLGWMLVSSERYMDKHCSDVADGYMTSDGDDDWHEHCEEEVARRHCCEKPSVCDDYRADLAKMLADEDERRTWANGRVEASWEWETINDDTKDIHWVAWLLKEHPVSHIRDGDEWLDIDDLVGFCSSCSSPCSKTKVVRLARDETGYVLDCNCGEDTPTTDPLLRWPPGIPAPLHLDGTLMAPMTEAYEEYMDEARQRRRRLREDAEARAREGQQLEG